MFTCDKLETWKNCVTQIHSDWKMSALSSAFQSLKIKSAEGHCYLQRKTRSLSFLHNLLKWKKQEGILVVIMSTWGIPSWSNNCSIVLGALLCHCGVRGLSRVRERPFLGLFFRCLAGEEDYFPSWPSATLLAGLQ